MIIPPKTDVNHHRPSHVTHKNRRREKGIGLIEVLVALLVLSFGLLGIAAMQATALRNNHSAAERSMAAILTHSIIDSMRANRSSALLGEYNYSGTSGNCTLPESGNLAQNDLVAWLQSMQLRDTSAGIRGIMSGSACGSVNCSDTGLCTIAIHWDDCRGTNDSTQAADCQTQTMTTEVQL